jgi:hypothetical protein
VCVALSFAGCVDREFDLADTSGEITVGGEELVLPIGEITPITLDELLKNNEMIQSNENGLYQITFSSFGNDPTKYEKISVEGISIPNITGLSPQLDPITFSFGALPTSLYFSGISKPIDLNMPSKIGEVMQIEPINIANNIDFAIPSQLSEQGTIDDQMLNLLNMLGLGTLSKSGSESVVFDATIEILEQLEKVDWVEFGCEDHPYGAPFNLKVDLKGLNDIVAGGSLKINVTFPEGYYLRDENGNDFPVATHNILSKELTIAPKQKEVEVLVYLHKIDYSGHNFTNGKLDIHDTITYSYDLTVNIGKGSYNLNSKSQIAIEAEPKYKDVEVKINHFDVPTYEEYFTQSFNGMPEGVSIDKVAFTQDSKFNVSVKGLEWCVIQDNLTGADISPKLEIDLPRSLHFREHPLLDENTNVLLASTTELSQGIELSLEYIDCKNSTGIKQENGQLLINEKIGAAIHMESLDGHTVLVSTITPPENLNISIGIADTRLNIDTANSVVTWSEDKSFNFDLKDNIPYISQSVDVPEMIAAIERIEIGKANSNDPVSMNFKLDAGSTFPVEELDINVAVNLGKLLRPTQKMFDEGLIMKNDNGDYLLTINESWKPKQSALVKTLEFDALENLPAIENGKITLNQSFPVTGGVKIKSGETIDLSAVSDAKVDIDFNVDDIEVRTFTGKVDISVKPESMTVDLGLGELNGVEIGALSLNPILTLRLKDNPTGVGLNANIKVCTYDKDGNKTSTINIPTIPVAGNGPSTIVLSTPRNASKFEGQDVTFIAVNGLSQLLKNGLPHKIGVDMEVASNKDEEITIDLKKAAQGYEIEYQYEVLLPFEFDGDVDLSYQTTIGDLNETFATIADSTNGLKVGDVGLIAEFGTTIPFDIVLSAELVNAEGTTDGIDARLNINECVIKGYNKSTDGEKSVSTIDLDFDLGENGSLECLKAADGVRFKLSIFDTGAASAELSKDQFVEGKLKLRVRNGLTIDVFDFLKEEGE